MGRLVIYDVSVGLPSLFPASDRSSPLYLKSICSSMCYFILGFRLGFSAFALYASALILIALIGIAFLNVNWVCYVADFGWFRVDSTWSHSRCCLILILCMSKASVWLDHRHLFEPESLSSSDLGGFKGALSVGLLRSVLQEGWFCWRIKWLFEELGELIIFCDLRVYIPYSRHSCLCATHHNLPTIVLFVSGLVLAMDFGIQQYEYLSLVKVAPFVRLDDAFSYKVQGQDNLTRDVYSFGKLGVITRICFLLQGEDVHQRSSLSNVWLTTPRVFKAFSTGFVGIIVVIAAFLKAWIVLSTPFVQRHRFIGVFESVKPSPVIDFPIVRLLAWGLSVWTSFIMVSTVFTFSNHLSRVTTLRLVLVLSTDGCWFGTFHTVLVTCVEGSTDLSSPNSLAVRFFKPTFDFHSWKCSSRPLRICDSSFDRLLQRVSDLFFPMDLVLSGMVLHLLFPSATSSVFKKVGASTQEHCDEVVAYYLLLVPSASINGFMKSGASTQERFVDVASFLPLHSLEVTIFLGIVSGYPCSCSLSVFESFMFSILMYVYLALVCRGLVMHNNMLASAANIRL